MWQEMPHRRHNVIRPLFISAVRSYAGKRGNAKSEFGMTPLTRRTAIKLGLAASASSLIGESRAQTSPPAGGTVFNMASFTEGGIEADAAFAKAIAAIEKAAAEAKKGGAPVHITFNLEKGATYRIKHPLAFRQLS